jgi:hypothetical protein
MKITKNELIVILSNQEKGTFVNLVTETKVRMNKKGNPYYGKVIKRSKCNYLLGMEYESRVRTNEEKEGLDPDFKTEKNKVGQHVSKCVLFNEKTGLHYVMVERFDEIKPNVQYLFEDNSIDKVLFNDFMIKYQESQKQEQERKVHVLSFTIDNVKELTLNKIKYEVE